MVKIVDSESLDNDHNYFNECAVIHTSVIPDGFLPTLGINFLASLYKAFSISKHSFLLLAIENGKVLGFIAVSLNTNMFFKWYIVRHMYKSIYRVPLKVLGRTFLVKVFELLSYPFSKKNINEEFISNSEVFNFCVDQGAQGLGVGQLLFSNAVAVLNNYKVEYLKIVTGSNQKGAQNFYYKVGAILFYNTEIHGNEDSLVFSYKIKDNE